MLWKQFVACLCKGYSAAPFSDYINNPTFQELFLIKDCFGDDSDEKVYFDFRDTLIYTNEIKKNKQKRLKTDTNNRIKICIFEKNKARGLGIYKR